MSTFENDAVWLDAHTRVSLDELARCSGLSEEMVRELVEYGALAPVDAHAEQWFFASEWIVRCRTASRLAADLELEAPVLALVLSFVRRIDDAEKELRALRARLGR